MSKQANGMSNSAFFKGMTSTIAPPDVKICKFGKVPLTCWNVPMRSLPFWHLYWNDTDCCELLFPERSVTFSRDTVAVIPPQVIFATRMNRLFEHFYIDFSVHIPRFAMIVPEVILLDAAPYRQELERHFEDYNAQLLHVHALLYRVLLDIPESQFAPAPKPSGDQRIRDVLDIIAREYHEELDNRRLCRKAGMSLSSFQHQFKQHTGLTPREYIINCRLDAARNLLLNTTLAITEIARQSGFADRYHFSKVFKRIFGTTPAAFRNSNGISVPAAPAAITS